MIATTRHLKWAASRTPGGTIGPETQDISGPEAIPAFTPANVEWITTAWRTICCVIATPALPLR